MWPLLAAIALSTPTVCIDPGHPSEVGLGTKGKLITELDAVWLVALELKPLLEAKGVQVVLTKATKDEFVANRRRAEIANASKADLLLRLHCDAASGSGLATYYPSEAGTAKDGKKGPSELVLARSAAAAKAFHPVVIERLKGTLPDYGLKTDKQTLIGSQQGALTGSIYSEVPVLLVELCVLTNPKDEAVIASDLGRRKIAEALAAGTMAVLGKRGGKGLE
ncbi:MAG: N-acetylmuramoyl-L-alanine amidase [Fimbriimonadaceae bacterium]|nr:N-acetylmuramoyl-L-alanine amidase [Fimbriimonadaceae bacterium]